jgi:signal transduction histidine kinase
MRAATASRLAALVVWVMGGIAVALVVWAVLNPYPGDIGLGGFVVLGAMIAVTALGALIVRRAGNPIGWIFQVMAIAGGVVFVAAEYVHASYGPQPRALPLASFAAWLTNVAPLAIALPIPLIFLLFPTGRPLSPRWRWAIRLLFVGAPLSFAWQAFRPGEIYGTGPPNRISIQNPLGIPWPGWVSSLLLNVGGFAVVAAGALGVAALVLRYRRSQGEERQQMRWLVFVAIAAAVALVASPLLDGTGFSDSFVGYAWELGILLLLGGIPAAVAIAVLRYRLYAIDLVISKTLVYGSLAAFITAIYVGIVVGIGALIGQGTSKPNLGLSILATGVVAVAFQPVRERVQRFANRLVYGLRATPYEVLSDFSHRMAGTYAADDVLPRMARILAEGTGAKESGVWLAVSGQLALAASWPDDGANSSAARPDGADLLIPVTHQGEELGALSITKPSGEGLTPAEEKLTRDLASQAGLVLRNVRLIEDLKASRVRLVQAQDEERRRIERNIHDGAQQQLVALNVRLGLAKRLVGDPAKIDSLLAELQSETNQALADLRDLARGIYPPLLQDKGLAAALESQARRASIPVTVHPDGIDRYSQEAEAAVYFCVLEALQNVAKYARAGSATVMLSATGGHLSFEVTDDGAGFDPSTTSYGTGLQGMADRLAALGGEIEVRSQPGHGTTVAGRLPVRALEPAG